MDEPDDHELEEGRMSVDQFDRVGDHVEVVVEGQRDHAREGKQERHIRARSRERGGEDRRKKIRDHEDQDLKT